MTDTRRVDVKINGGNVNEYGIIMRKYVIINDLRPSIT